MSIIKSLLRWVGIAASGIGIVVCVGAIIATWMLTSRVNHLADSLLSAMDRSLVVVGQRTDEMHERVVAAKLTTADVEKSMRDWTKRETGERLALQLQAAGATDQLTVRLQTIGDWLAIADSSLEVFQELASLRASLGVGSDRTVQELAAEIASLRTQLDDTTTVVAKLQDRIAGTSEQQPLEDRIEQVVQLTLRVVATLSSLDARLLQFSNRLSAARQHLDEVKTTTWRWTLIIASGISLLFIWIGAGQIALFRVSWNRSRSTA
jgi:chromosome segregation ATPase